MKMPNSLPELFLSGISQISIDASSIIYMLKTGILGYTAAEMVLLADQRIIDEVGWPRLPVRSVALRGRDGTSNDQTVIMLAEERNLPVLSEDLEILKEAEDKGIPHFNTLMILNYLVLKGRIESREYSEYHRRLEEISHYSSEVLEYGREINRLVLRELS